MAIAHCKSKFLMCFLIMAQFRQVNAPIQKVINARIIMGWVTDIANFNKVDRQALLISSEYMYLLLQLATNYGVSSTSKPWVEMIAVWCNVA